MADDAGLLVDREEVRVLVDDVERDRFRDDVVGFGRRDQDLNDVAAVRARS